MTEAEFQGMPCDCSAGKYRHYTHIAMLYNPALVDYVSNSLITNDVQKTSAMVDKMTEVELKSFGETCQLLQASKDVAGTENDAKIGVSVD